MGAERGVLFQEWLPLYIRRNVQTPIALYGFRDLEKKFRVSILQSPTLSPPPSYSVTQPLYQLFTVCLIRTITLCSILNVMQKDKV